MGWDATAVLIVEICSIEGLLDLKRRSDDKNAGLTNDYVEGYLAGLTDRVSERFWFSKESEALGNALGEGQEYEEWMEASNRLHEIVDGIKAALAKKERDPEAYQKMKENGRKELISILERIRDKSGGAFQIELLSSIHSRLTNGTKPID
jgi:hypothetical protein